MRERRRYQRVAHGRWDSARSRSKELRRRVLETQAPFLTFPNAITQFISLLSSQIFYDQDGNPYYYNVTNEECSYTRPKSWF